MHEMTADSPSISILDQIVEKRRKDLDELGPSLGYNVPDTRQRKITPFLPHKGIILEIKRASPSKGDINPELNVYNTAQIYAQAGAQAVSVLTEKHWFKGSLDDLMTVCSAVDSLCESGAPDAIKPAYRPAVLRKDFLIEEDEIDVSYTCGADAVLLIARVLSKEKILSMAGRCLSLGMSALVEIREEDDIQKLDAVLAFAEKKGFNGKDGKPCIAAGVNTRDLATFVTDPLIPSSYRASLPEKIVYESGIRTPEAARYVGSMGFHAVLLGEAAARSPENAHMLVHAFLQTKPDENALMWTLYAAQLRLRRKSGTYLPFIKICGINDFESALAAADAGADFLGFIFCTASRRNTTEALVRQIKKELVKIEKKSRFEGAYIPAPKLVGVITDPLSPEAQTAFSLVRQKILDIIQFHNCPMPLHGDPSFADIPRWSALGISSSEDIETLRSMLEKGQPRVLIDAKTADGMGGTGTAVDIDLCRKAASLSPLWIAGGISPENIGSIIENFNPELIDVSSSIEESPGIKDTQKMIALFDAFDDACEKRSNK